MADVLDLETLIGWDDLLTDEARQTRASVRRFVNDALKPGVTTAWETGTFPDELTLAFADLGLFGANLRGYGCAGVSNLAYGMALHELERCDSGYRSFVSVQTSLAMYAIHRFGSEAQKRRWLPEMAAGRTLGCFGLSEPDHGSDPGAMATYAVRDGADWVLSGSKMWITNAQVAGVAVVWARERGGEGRIRGFLVERGTEGFETGDIPHKLSMRASHTGVLYLDEVRVPEANRLPEAAGLASPLAVLNNARLGVAFGVLGAARECLELALTYARERTQFGVPIARKQLVQKRLVDVAEEVVKASVLTAHYGGRKDRGALSPAQVSLLKRNNCRIALEAAREARAVLGANGITTDHHVLRHALNLESTYTYEGTHEIHTLVLGRALTGESAF